MKKSLFIITTMSLMFTLVAQSCDSSTERLENAETAVIEAERDVDIAQAEIESEIRIYRQEIANDIRENNMVIAEIKEKIEAEEGDVKATFETKITELEHENDNLKRQIDNYHVSNRNHWNDFKQDFNSNMDNLGNSLVDFFTTTTTSGK